MTFHFRSRLWHHVSIPTEVDGFVIPSPTWLPRFVHVFILSLSLSFSLLFLLSPSTTVSLATESRVSLSPALSLFSFFSPPQRRSLSPSLSLFSFFSPPQRRSLSRWRVRSLSLPLFLSSLSSLPLSDGLSLSLSFSLLFLLSPSATVSLSLSFSL